MATNIIEQAIRQVITHPHSPDVRAPGLATPRPGNPRAAIRRCCAAWQRSFDAYMTAYNDGSDYLAGQHAGPAYCNAMPILSGDDGIRDFIACAAHGILIGAIPENRGGQVLYAARVAMAAIQNKRKSPNSAVPPTPVPQKPHLPGRKTPTKTQRTQQHKQSILCTKK